MNTQVLSEFNKEYDSSLEASRLASEDINQYWLDLGMPAGLVTQLELCVVEMVNNAFIHAYHYQEGKPIGLSCVFNHSGDRGIMTMRVSDQGDAMSQADLDKELSREFVEADPEDESTWATSGRGFLIVSSLMDKIELSLESEKNTFLLTKELDSTSMQQIILSTQTA
ncbi:ATP-binding protein [Vibrio sp. T187]|uniref:ATP-binding protein n=1 Tax=Vibrio TaxID=662 RepID=UPI0010C9CBF3|nr:MULTISPECIES: ATP-binding protein [Vibrio]MBW3695778.1 ATP-binding protein [Vibrio sp. T187]